MELLLQRISASADRHSQHTAAYFALSALLHHTAGVKSAVLSRSELGKPYLPGGVMFSVSHCSGLIACAAGDETPIGVDAEPIRVMRPRVASRCFSAAEQELLRSSDQPDLLFTRLWTLKESYVKAIGRGVSFPMNTLSFSFDGNRISEAGGEFQYAQFLTPDGFVISVCHRYADGTFRVLDQAPEFESLFFSDFSGI